MPKWRCWLHREFSPRALGGRRVSSSFLLSEGYFLTIEGHSGYRLKGHGGKDHGILNSVRNELKEDEVVLWTPTDCRCYISWGSVPIGHGCMKTAKCSGCISPLPFPSQCFDQNELLECIRKLVEVEKEWVPYSTSASLYIRPTLIGTEVWNIFFPLLTFVCVEAQSKTIHP